ncbi:MAG: 2'-5' RNA ligase family protein [Promethearchaeota archaeon]
MPFAIVLTFDEKNTRMIEKVLKKFKETEISPLMYEEKIKPHITLAIYDEINSDVAKDRLILFSIENPQFIIQISSIGYFPSEESVIFLNPKANIALLSIQEKIFRLFKDFESNHFPETWVPHCTLGMYIQKENISRAIDIIKEEIIMTKEKPFYVTAKALSLVKFQEDPLRINWWLDYNLKE